VYSAEDPWKNEEIKENAVERCCECGKKVFYVFVYGATFYTLEQLHNNNPSAIEEREIREKISYLVREK